MKELYTSQEVADILKVHISSIVRYRQEGMPFIRIGHSIRFDADEVMEWIEKQN